MNLRKLGNKFLMSIPHLSSLFDMRRNQRYVLNEGVRVEIKINDARINGRLFDISFGGMRLISSDKQIENSKTISLSTDDFHVDLPCKTMWKDERYYGIEFGSMNRREFGNFRYFIEHFTKEAEENEVIGMLR